METIYKYDFPFGDNIHFKMPEGAQVLTVQYQGDELKLWALVNPENESKDYYFEIFETGHPVKVGMFTVREYITTVQKNDLVWHIFHRKL
jgi:hypothetical protein